ncbi:MAG: amidohydrolase family protein [Planctomycetota bacterium]|nr:amidohydrolase family protein [Planctomycetota bacterium]
MIILPTFLSLAATATVFPEPTLMPAAAGDLLAIRARTVESVSDGTLTHAVILVEEGKFATVGEDLTVERGIPTLDLPEDWVVVPGLVNAYSRQGMDSSGGSGADPDVLASSELYPGADVYQQLLEAGVTTLGLYPAGNGIPGQAVAIRPTGDTLEEMILDDAVYLKIILRSNASSKKMLRKGFEEADAYEEKEAKARAKWDKDQEKKKKKKKDDDDDEDKEDEEEDDGVYTPPTPDDDVQPFLDLRNGELSALISISKAGDYLHLLDALGEEEFSWDLRIPLSSEADIFHVADKIGERGCRVLVEPRVTRQPSNMRQRNLPAELVEAGATLAFVPNSDSVSNQKVWLRDVGHVVAAGLDRQTALRAMTLEPAAILGLDERLGSISSGKDANLLIYSGDPFEPTSRLVAVMFEGRFVTGEKDLR